MNENNQVRSLRINIRVNEEEMTIIEGLAKSSTYGYLARYARNLLLNKPQTFKTRDQSLDELLHAIISLKKEIGQIGILIAQALKKLSALESTQQVDAWISMHHDCCLAISAKLDELD